MPLINYLEMARARSTEYLDYGKFRNCFPNVQYGDVEREKLDIFLPDSKGNFPVILHVTGGGFVYGDKSMKKMQGVFLDMLSRGYAIVSMNYSLSDTEKFPVPIWQTKRVIRFIKTHGKEYHLDSKNIFLYGNSAGGYIVTLTAFTDSSDSFLDGQNSGGRAGDCSINTDINAVATIYGLSDLVNNSARFYALTLEPKYIEDGDESASIYFMGNTSEKTNVIDYIKKNHPPILIEHGKADHTVSPLHSYELANALYKIGGASVECHYFDGLDHSDAYFKSTENTNRIINFFDKFKKS